MYYMGKLVMEFKIRHGLILLGGGGASAPQAPPPPPPVRQWHLANLVKHIFYNTGDLHVLRTNATCRIDMTCYVKFEY